MNGNRNKNTGYLTPCLHTSSLRAMTAQGVVIYNVLFNGQKASLLTIYDVLIVLTVDAIGVGWHN